MQDRRILDITSEEVKRLYEAINDVNGKLKNRLAKQTNSLARINEALKILGITNIQVLNKSHNGYIITGLTNDQLQAINKIIKEPNKVMRATYVNLALKNNNGPSFNKDSSIVRMLDMSIYSYDEKIHDHLKKYKLYEDEGLYIQEQLKILGIPDVTIEIEGDKYRIKGRLTEDQLDFIKKITASGPVNYMNLVEERLNILKSRGYVYPANPKTSTHANPKTSTVANMLSYLNAQTSNQPPPSNKNFKEKPKYSGDEANGYHMYFHIPKENQARAENLLRKMKDDGLPLEYQDGFVAIKPSKGQGTCGVYIRYYDLGSADLEYDLTIAFNNKSQRNDFACLMNMKMDFPNSGPQNNISFSMKDIVLVAPTTQQVNKDNPINLKDNQIKFDNKNGTHAVVEASYQIKNWINNLAPESNGKIGDYFIFKSDPYTVSINKGKDTPGITIKLLSGNELLICNNIKADNQPDKKGFLKTMVNDVLDNHLKNQKYEQPKIAPRMNR